MVISFCYVSFFFSFFPILNFILKKIIQKTKCMAAVLDFVFLKGSTDKITCYVPKYHHTKSGVFIRQGQRQRIWWFWTCEEIICFHKWIGNSPLFMSACVRSIRISSVGLKPIGHLTASKHLTYSSFCTMFVNRK